MKKPGIITLVCFSLLVSGCLFNDGSDDDTFPVTRNSLGIGAIAAKYFPMKAGSVWNYDTTNTSFRDGKTRTYSESYSAECRAKYTSYGTTFSRIIEDNNGFRGELNYRFDGDDVFNARGGFSTIPRFPRWITKAIAKKNENSQLYESEFDRLYYRFNVPVGSTWTIYESIETHDQEPYDSIYYKEGDFWKIIRIGKYVGYETITTEHGAFENCMKFEYKTKTNYQNTLIEDPENDTTGVKISGNSEEKEYTWFAPDIGIVKKTQNFTDSDGNSSNSETILTSYEIETVKYDSTEVYSVRGNVMTWDGIGIPEVNITVEGENSSYQGITDNSGCFLIDGLTEGNYILYPINSGIDIKPSITAFSIIDTDIKVGAFLCEENNCIKTSPPSSIDSYLNFKNGAFWIYTYTSFYVDGEPFNSNEFVYKCLGAVQHEYNGESCIKLYRGMFRDEEYYQVDGNDVFLYGILPTFFIGHHAGTEKKISVGNDDYVSQNINDQKIMCYRFGLSAGQGWEIIYVSTNRDGYMSNDCLTGRYAGLESVNTEAGLFENCARFELCSQIAYSTVSYSRIVTRWFAPYVGMVKETVVEYISESNDALQMDSRRFHLKSELVLQRYSIP